MKDKGEIYNPMVRRLDKMSGGRLAVLRKGLFELDKLPQDEQDQYRPAIEQAYQLEQERLGLKKE